MTFKPMLAADCEGNTSILRFPLLASPKLDGVRALVMGRKLVSRNLKPIPNQSVQDMFEGLPEGLDGELIKGDPTKQPYRDTVSCVMRHDSPPEGVNFYVFDNYILKSFRGFATRFLSVQSFAAHLLNVVVVPHWHVETEKDLLAIEERVLDEGYEGLMLRSIDGPYKEGRATLKEGYLTKLKRFVDAEALVLDTFEQMKNTNEATLDLLGHTERSDEKAGMVGKGVLGGLVVRGLGGVYDGVEFRIGTGEGLTAVERANLWAQRETLPGRIAKFKYFPTGSDTKPRFPIWLGWRESGDL